MSAYITVESEITAKDSIIKALLDIGFLLNEIEVHENPTSLYGYHGDKRSDTAEVIVRQKYVNSRMSGGSSNDIGFKLVNGKWTPIISEYDQKWWTSRENRFKQIAATNDVVRQLQRKGKYVITQREEHGVIKVYAKSR